MPDQAPSIPACPRCGQPAGPQFSGSGLCPACAAAALLHQTQDGASLSVFPEAVSGPEGIGPYRIIATLGVGGMGTVYLAQHRQLGRVVALKAIPLHGGGHPLRFQREAQTIAALRHPHIVTVHDAGQDAQHFYFAMDYVEGGDLAARLRQKPFAPREAAALMQKVADAVAHSHAHGMLHRDLKPSNILLDGDEPRVADFGLAAPVEAGGDLTQHTSVLGTPHYLAPEALLKGSAAQSPASDVYSLGVILYELLCGRLPHTAATPAELLQLVTTTEPRLLAPGIARDLETICLKALAAEPARRYVTAAAFATDLRRFLAGEPIVARPLSAPVRLWRWARRRPTLAALWLMLLVLAAGSTAAAWRINRERRAAEAAAARSQALLAFLSDDLLGQSLQQKEPDPALKMRTVVDRAAANLDARFAAQPDLAQPISQIVGDIYLALGDYALTRQHYERALALSLAQFGPADARTLQARHRLGRVLVNLGLYPEARAQLGPAFAQSAELNGPASVATLEIAATLGTLLINEGRFDGAAALLEPAVAAARHIQPRRPACFGDLLINLAGVYGRQQRYEPCIALLREAIEFRQASGGPQNPETLAAMQSLGVAYLGSNRNDEGERLLTEVLAARRKMFGPEHPRTLVTLGSLARAQLNLGRHAEAATTARELLATRQRLLGPDHPDTLRSLETLAAIHTDAGDFSAAQPVAEEALERRRKVLGPTHADTLNSTRLLAYVALQSHDPARVIALLEQLPAPPGKSGPGPWQFATQQAMLGTAWLQTGQPAKAEPLLRAAHQTLTAQRAQLTLFWPRLADTLPAALAEATR